MFFTGEDQIIRYFVHGGDSEGWFSLDPFLGLLKTSAFLDYEKQHSVLLNVQAVYGNAASTAFTQVSKIKILDCTLSYTRG